MVECLISQYKQKNLIIHRLKTGEEIEKELKEARSNLLNWALELPDLKNNNLERKREK